MRQAHEHRYPTKLMEMVVAFVDRQDGLDAPLSAIDERRVRQLVDDDLSVRGLVTDLQATNAALETLFDDVISVRVPARLSDLIRSASLDA